MSWASAYQAKAHQYYKEPLEMEEEIKYLLEPLIAKIQPKCKSRLGGDEVRDGAEQKYIVSHILSVNPVLQKGPMCGIVALTMAHDLLRSTSKHPDRHKTDNHPESILEFAKQAGLTKQGEMFSTEYMKEIGEQYLSCKVEEVSMETVTTRTLLKWLSSSSKSIIVPYDADKNHSPCLAKGHKAHWCLLVGFAAVLKSNSTLLQHCTQLCYNRHLLLLNEHAKEEFLSFVVSEQCLIEEVYVYARHGKSRRMGLWEWEQLRMSNGNLVEVDPHRTQPGEYVIPQSGGIKNGLCSRLVIVSASE